MIDLRDLCSAPPTSVKLGAAKSFVVPVMPPNPIGLFNTSRTQILKAGNPSLLANHPIVGRLLLLGAVSAFENYCRGILAGCLAMCPISQAKASDKNIHLGGAIWNSSIGNVNKGAFEHKSFADTRELRSAFKEYVGFELTTGTFNDILDSYESLMQLRHAVVHADGYLPGKNALKLELNNNAGALLVSVNQNSLQECLLVLSTLVSTINRELFVVMCRRWAKEWRIRADWQPSLEGKMLAALYDLFIDRLYQTSLPRAKAWTRKKIGVAALAQFGI